MYNALGWIKNWQTNRNINNKFWQTWQTETRGITNLDRQADRQTDRQTGDYNQLKSDRQTYNDIKRMKTTNMNKHIRLVIIDLQMLNIWPVTKSSDNIIHSLSPTLVDQIELCSYCWPMK